jgi:thymidine kinase
MPRVEASVRKGAHVILAGLDLTSRGEPFGSMPAFLALADHVTKLRAKCAVCGRDGANRSHRVVDDGRTVLVGGAEAYEPRCLACFEGAVNV